MSCTPVIFYCCLISVNFMYGAAYQSTESALIDHAQRRISYLKNQPLEIQMNDEVHETSDCRKIGKKIVSGLAFLFCCSKKKSDEGRYLRCKDSLSFQTFMENELPQSEPIDAAQQMYNRRLLDLLDSRFSDAKAIEWAVLCGANPWEQIPDASGKLLSPLLYAVELLDDDDTHVRDLSNKIYAMLHAHRLQEEQLMQSEQCEQICDKHLQMRYAVKELIGEFGRRQDVQAFEQYGTLWGEICSLLGVDMTSMRAGVFSLLKKKDVFEPGDFVIHKTLQTQFGSFERFALACAVHDFVYCLAATLATKTVYDVQSFCERGVLVKAGRGRAPVCKANAEWIRMMLNPEVNARLSSMISLLTMRVGL